MRKAVDIAKGGDVAMLKFLLGRILPRERPIQVELPHGYKSNQERAEAIAAVILAVAEGKLSPAEGSAIAALMDTHQRALEYNDMWKEMDILKAELIAAGIELPSAPKLE